MQRAGINNVFFLSIAKASPYQHYCAADNDQYNSDVPVHDGEINIR